MKANKDIEQKISKSECESISAVVDISMEDCEKPQDQLVKSAKKSKKQKPAVLEAPKKEEAVLPDKVS